MPSGRSRCSVRSGSSARPSAATAKPPAPPPPPAVTVAPVLERDIAEWDEFSGRLAGGGPGGDPAPRLGLHQAASTFTEGREVRKGEVLFEIDPRPYQADLDRAQAAAGAGAHRGRARRSARWHAPRSW